MQVNIGPIKEQKGAELAIHAVEDWSHLEEQGQPLGFVGPVVFDGRIGWTGECFLLRGTASAFLKVVCSRCLQSHTVGICAEILEEYQSAPGGDGQWREEDLPESQDEWATEDVQRFHGNVIDLNPVVLENLLLAVPLKPLCKDDCLGLCAVCGHDLNLRPCGCKVDETNPSMDILRLLLNGED